MEICRKIDERKAATFLLSSEADSQAVVAKARGTEWFPEEASLPRVKGSTIVVAPRGDAMFNAMMVYRRRFADGPWDVGEGQDRDEWSRRDWDRTIEAVGASVATALAAPEGDEVVLKTER
ncbi:hypothetical protein ACYOEI_34240, partial [Singulisphaera rosea]